MLGRQGSQDRVRLGGLGPDNGSSEIRERLRRLSKVKAMLDSEIRREKPPGEAFGLIVSGEFICVYQELVQKGI